MVSAQGSARATACPSEGRCRVAAPEPPVPLPHIGGLGLGPAAPQLPCVPQPGRSLRARHVPKTTSQGFFSAHSDPFSSGNISKGSAFLFFFFFKLQTINYELKRKSQPSFPPLKFGGSKHEAAQCRNKTVHPVLSETKAVVGFVLFCLFVCFLELSVP